MSSEVETEPLIQSSFVRLFGAIIVGLIGVSFVMTNMSRKAVMAEWAKRRCDVGVMFSGFLYKPADYGGSAMEFASENFDFCLKVLASQALGQATTPAIRLMESQVKGGGVIQDIQNGIRTLLAKIVDSFSTVLQSFYETYRRGMLQFARVWQTFRSMTGRMEASVVSTMYAFLSGYTGILNSVDFIIRIAIIMINIIASLFILMFFTFLPFLPVLIGSVNMITSAGYGDKVKGPASIFCFGRGTLIHAADGRLIPIEQLIPGTTLKGGGVYEGAFKFDGSATPLYLLNDVLVSGSHLVYDDDTGAAQAVEDDPRARKTALISPILYCPIVGNRILYAGRSAIKFADWEEVAGEAEDAYDTEVRRILSVMSGSATLPPGFCDQAVGIITKERGLMKISDARIGEHILDSDDHYSRILGLVKRRVKVDRIAELTDGIIHFKGGMWTYEIGGMAEGNQEIDIYHIITDSGTFAVMRGDSWIITRDATEVGLERLDDLTPLVLSHLNNSSE